MTTVFWVLFFSLVAHRVMVRLVGPGVRVWLDISWMDGWVSMTDVVQERVELRRLIMTASSDGVGGMSLVY